MKAKRELISVGALFLLVLLAGVGAFAQDKAEKDRGPAEIHFFCGSAVKVPMDEIIKEYSKERGVKVNVIYGGSGTLLAQMELSRKGDLYLCGSPDYITIGERRGLLVKGTARQVAYLVPAIIVPKGNPAGIKCLEDLGKPGVRVGMGNPETVCLGLYGVELLDSNGLMESVLSNVAVFGRSCSDTASLAALGKVDAILGWDVFESWNPDKVEWIRIEPERIPRISYVALAIPIFVKEKPLAADLMDYILSERGKSVFAKWGYMADQKEAKRYAPEATIGGEYKLPDRYFEIIGRQASGQN